MTTPAFLAEKERNSKNHLSTIGAGANFRSAFWPKSSRESNLLFTRCQDSTNDACEIKGTENKKRRPNFPQSYFQIEFVERNVFATHRI